MRITRAACRCPRKPAPEPSPSARNPIVNKLCLLTALAATALAFAPSTRADTTNLIFATTEPAGSDDSMRVFSPWAAQIGKATNDAIHIDLREGFAIANSTNIYDRVQSDVAQVGILIPSLIGGKFPLTDVVGLPFVTQGFGSMPRSLSGGFTRPARSTPNTKTSCPWASASSRRRMCNSSRRRRRSTICKGCACASSASCPASSSRASARRRWCSIRATNTQRSSATPSTAC